MPNADLPEAVGPAMRTAPIPTSLTCQVSRWHLPGIPRCDPLANPSRAGLTRRDRSTCRAASLGHETERSVLASGIAADLIVPRPGATKAVRRACGSLRRPAGRRRRAAAGDPAQAPVPGRHGFHHDRAGMHRRAGRLCRAEGGGLRDHRARHARRDRLRAGLARAGGAAQGPAGRRRRRDHRRAHHADAGRPDARRRPCARNGAYTCLVSGGFTLFTGPIGAKIGFDEHRSNRAAPRGRAACRQRRGADPRPRGEARDPDRTARALRLSPHHETSRSATAPTISPCWAKPGLGVAFRAKPAVAAAAHARIDHADLTALLYAQGYTADDIVATPV